tara:strand:+ start:1445 stop:2032 length:588 start_codon:yes stop_codon:yes gene_type:complete
MSIKQKIKMQQSSINLEEDKVDSLANANTNDIKELSAQVIKLRALEDKLTTKEEELKKIKNDIDVLSGEVIPTMMTEMNISKFSLADGAGVEVKPVYGASIPKAKEEEAFNWLRNNGLGDIIKNMITVSFGRNEDNKAANFAVLAQGQGYQPTQKLKVEPMTLKALVRERTEKGLEMPTDLFNVFAGNRTKITRK